MLCYEGSPRSFHQNQIELFIMIKGGLLYAQEEVWRLYLHLLCSARARARVAQLAHCTLQLRALQPIVCILQRRNL